MFTKSKRKVPPRKFTRIKLVGFLISMLGLIYFLTNFHLPGQQIVYINVDENGVKNIFLADLNDPENPQQLTFHDEDVIDWSVASNGSIVTYRIEFLGEILLLDLKTRQTVQITNCEIEGGSCNRFAMRSDGKFLAYLLFQTTPSRKGEIYITDLQNDTYLSQLIVEIDAQYYGAHLHWIGNSNYVKYQLPYDPEFGESFKIYDIVNNRSIGPYPSGAEFWGVLFTDDGSCYTNIHCCGPFGFQVRDTRNPNHIFTTFHRRDSDSLHQITGIAHQEKWLAGSAYEWHPDNETLLISILYNTENPYFAYQSELGLLNTTTNVVRQLTDAPFVVSIDATFNADATKILYQQVAVTEAECCYDQIMIYDLETDEIIPLPIYGTNPRWVN